MTLKRYTFDALEESQIEDFTIGGVVAPGDSVSVIIGNKRYTHVATTASATTEATALVAELTALSASTYPEFYGLTWTNPSAGVARMTGAAGVAYVTAETQAGSAITFVKTTVQGPGGPSVANDPDNWEGVPPVAGDDLLFTNSSRNILYGLDTFDAEVFGSLESKPKFTGELGLPYMNNAAQTIPYRENRPRYFQCAGLTNGGVIGSRGVSSIGGFAADGQGSRRFMLDVGAGDTTMDIFSTGAPAEAGVPTVLLLGTNLKLNLSRGSVGVAFHRGEVATISPINQDWLLDQDADSELQLGSGAALNTIVKSGGLLVINGNTTSLIHRGGETVLAAGAHALLEAVEAGHVRYRGVGTLTAGIVASGAHLDFSQVRRSRTVTNLTLRKGYALSDPYKSVIHTNPPDFQCDPFFDGTLRWGTNIKLQRS